MNRQDDRALYERFASLGIDYGPAFRGITSISGGDGEALATVRLAEGLEARRAPIHPALLDAIFQTAAAAAPDLGTVFLPFGWERRDSRRAGSATARRTCSAARRNWRECADGDCRFHAI